MSTLKRHGYYCRSRKAGSTIRLQSCISCAKGKARCNKEQPCSRCRSKAIECHYPPKPLRRTAAGSLYVSEVQTLRQGTAPLLSTSHSSSDYDHDINGNSNVLLDPALEIPRPALTGLANGVFDPSIEFADFSSLSSNVEGAWYDSFDSSNLARPSPSPNDATQRIQQAANRSIDLIFHSPSTYNIRSFNHRAQSSTFTQRTSNLILHTLKSYPIVILRDQTLPPFIHPHLVSKEVENNDMEPLSNCVNLIHMLSSGFSGSRKLSWKNVRMDCESLYTNVRLPSFSSWWWEVSDRNS